MLCAKQHFFSLRLILNSVACLAAFARNSFVFFSCLKTNLNAAFFRVISAFISFVFVFLLKPVCTCSKSNFACECVSVSVYLCVCLFWDVEIDLLLFLLKQRVGNGCFETEIRLNTRSIVVGVYGTAIEGCVCL